MPIRGHLEELYGLEVSPDLISRVTDAVLDEVKEWRYHAQIRERARSASQNRLQGRAMEKSLFVQRTLEEPSELKLTLAHDSVL